METDVWAGSPFLTEEKLLPQFDSLSMASSCTPSGHKKVLGGLSHILTELASIMQSECSSYLRHLKYHWPTYFRHLNYSVNLTV